MLVGLTGGIASGKSTVSAMLSGYGAHVVDADVIARIVVEPGKPALQELVQNFGKSILLPDGTLDRPKLGQVVFGDQEKLALINRITHPRVRDEMMDQVAEAMKSDPYAIVVLDVPLLIEGGLVQIVQKCIVVYVDPEVQLCRLMQRDGSSEEEASRRIGSQIPLAEKTKYADYVIDNNGSLEETKTQVDRVWQALKKL